MPNDAKHPIRNGIIVTVVGGVLLALVLWSAPFFLSSIKSIGNFISFNLSRIWKYIFSSVSIPGWSLWLLILLSVPTVLKLINPIFIRRQGGPTIYDYYEDKFHNINWQWKYINKEPYELRAFCPECNMELVHATKNKYSAYYPATTLFYCEHCTKELAMLKGDIEFVYASIAREIERRIRTGEWRNRIDFALNK